MKNSIVSTKSFDLSLKVISLSKMIKFELKEYDISRQLLRSCTSIGANLEESNAAFSKKEFLSKIYISYKESFETRYWLKLLREGYKLDTTKLIAEVNEIINILTKTIKTTKKNLELEK